MNIKLLDLQSQHQKIKDKVRARIDRVLEHGQYIMGPEIGELETRLAGFAGAKHAISCASGTDALLLALMAYDVKAGDAVFTSDFTFIATAEVIALLGATPVFVDIEPGSKNISPASLEEKIAKVVKEGNLRPRGIIPVDLFGLPADYGKIEKIAEKHGLFVIEDAAQSFGASYKGKKAGSLGTVGATSFFPAKPLGCYGDGGAVFTEDAALAEKMKSIRVHGQGNDKYNNVRIGLNARLDTLQAAILLAKLDIFESEIKNRQRVAALYSQGLKKAVKIPEIVSESSCAWAQYSVEHPQREEIRKFLTQKGIPTAVYYPVPLHLQPAFSFLGGKQGDYPVSEKAALNIFSLPMHPYLEDTQINFIIQEVCEAVKQHA